MENVYEQFFFLKYSGGWSFMESYNLPIGLRKWFVERLLQQLQMEKEAVEQASSGNSNSSSHVLSERNQPETPQKYVKKYG